MSDYWSTLKWTEPHSVINAFCKLHPICSHCRNYYKEKINDQKTTFHMTLENGLTDLTCIVGIRWIRLVWLNCTYHQDVFNFVDSFWKVPELKKSHWVSAFTFFLIPYWGSFSRRHSKLSKKLSSPASNATVHLANKNIGCIGLLAQFHFFQLFETNRCEIGRTGDQGGDAQWELITSRRYTSAYQIPPESSCPAHS